MDNSTPTADASGKKPSAPSTSAGVSGSATTPSAMSDRTLNESPKKKMSGGKKALIFLGSCLLILIIIAGIIIAVIAYAVKKSPSFVNSVQNEVKKEVINSTGNTVSGTADQIDTAAADILREVRMADEINADFEPTHISTTFRPSDKTFYCTVRTKSVDQGTTVIAKWYYLDQDQFVDEKEFTTEAGVNQIAFNLTRPDDHEWPAGRYEVRLYVGDKLGMIVPFEVQ